MKKQLKLMALALALGGLHGYAQQRIVIVPTDGSKPEKGFAMKSVGRMGFASGGFTVETTDGASAPYTYGQVARIKFDNDAAGIGCMTDGRLAALKPYYRDGLLCVEGLEAGQTARAVVTDMSGRVVLKADAWRGSPIEVGALASGVYTFSVNNQTIKFSK